MPTKYVPDVAMHVVSNQTWCIHEIMDNEILRPILRNCPNYCRVKFRMYAQNFNVQDDLSILIDLVRSLGILLVVIVAQCLYKRIRVHDFEINILQSCTGGSTIIFAY
jgi:hypothetical protein